jgi:hypothetical protein
MGNYLASAQKIGFRGAAQIPAIKSQDDQFVTVIIEKWVA